MPLVITATDWDVDCEDRIYFFNPQYLMITVYQLYTNEYLYSIKIPEELSNSPQRLEMNIVNDKILFYYSGMITEMNLNGDITGYIKVKTRGDITDYGMAIQSSNRRYKDNKIYTKKYNIITVSEENGNDESVCFIMPIWNKIYEVSYLILLVAGFSSIFIIIGKLVFYFKKHGIYIQ